MEIKDVIWEKICQKEAELSELEYFYNNKTKYLEEQGYILDNKLRQLEGYLLDEIDKFNYSLSMFSVPVSEAKEYISIIDNLMAQSQEVFNQKILELDIEIEKNAKEFIKRRNKLETEYNQLRRDHESANR
ncbi:hypothetical protein O3686_07695 [Streptococcus parasanguinis]|jgi:hypothetical protein|uniref:hypothetical protein n=1 Tax=Streptococcus parasanguinis TaxID=1318 RepID=UPI001D07D420|nr:hypothetical protein [Streptococcus parasanguinis]MCB6704272.1 hypothetical protein [Streptococcus parasanguinis]MCB6738925.1 hypothetical protein [Streptococcus parasanguinis]MCB7322971.1 hypothetical protein [Streptococcus parasanguinis]MCB7401154.1 hypothetical protein [Streptococcus parasanguinis]